MKNIKTNQTTIAVLIVGITLILLRILFPVLICEVPKIGYTPNLCPKGQLASFSTNPPVVHLQAPYNDISFYKASSTHTYGQAIVLTLLVGLIYFLVSKKAPTGNTKNVTSDPIAYYHGHETTVKTSILKIPSNKGLLVPFIIPLSVLITKLFEAGIDTTIYTMAIAYMFVLNYVNRSLKSRKDNEFRTVSWLFLSLLLASVLVALIVAS